MLYNVSSTQRNNENRDLNGFHIKRINHLKESGRCKGLLFIAGQLRSSVEDKQQ